MMQVATNWNVLIQQETEKKYFADLIDFVSQEYAQNVCFPPQNLIFECFNHFDIEQTKIVILGQDPYHGQGQANGLAFSLNAGCVLQPSLRNIFKELMADVAIDAPFSGNLEFWAKQGVLLLNDVLTVRSGQAGSHQKQGWETFTNAVISHLSATQKNLVFMLWGTAAQKKGRLIDGDNHLILNSGHPSPMSANRGHWFGNKHFSQANAHLEKLGKEPINWGDAAW